MKKIISLFISALTLVLSFISCNGITDIYSNQNYNVIISLPGSTDSRSSYTTDEVLNTIKA